MYLRPYNKTKDFEYILKWVADKKTHALWCANLLPFPLTEGAFHEYLMQNEKDWGGCGYTFTNSFGQPVGFCVFSVNEPDHSGYLGFVVLDDSLRGQGKGKQMLQILLKYAFEIAGVDLVKLNVFDVNTVARKCYESVGFVERDVTPDALQFGEESWGRCLMVAHRQPDFIKVSRDF